MVALLYSHKHLTYSASLCAILEGEFIYDLEYLLGLSLFDLMRRAAQIDKKLVKAVNDSPVDNHENHYAFRTIS